MEQIQQAIEQAPRIAQRPRTGQLWPESLDPVAYHGIIGKIVTTIAPHTEADPAALLGHALTYAGNAIGRGPHTLVEGARHGTNLYMGIVGETAKGRKGSANSQINRIFKAADEAWVLGHLKSGLSSGEGLIYHVRDELAKSSTEGDTVVVDPGVVDKRLLVAESELATPLKKMGQQGNILSATLREAWDSGDLSQLTKNNPVRATGAHISVIGHIAKLELIRLLKDEELANGFANRFIWFVSKRAQVLPEGGSPPEQATLVVELQEALTGAAGLGELRRDQDARALWAEVYPQLSEGKPGLVGMVGNRAEAQVQRLQNLYAALDGSSLIRRAHVEAALAVWEYSERSIRYIFGDKTGNPTADKIRLALLGAANGMNRSEIWRCLGRNPKAHEVDEALELLTADDLAHRATFDSEERWFAS